MPAIRNASDPHVRKLIRKGVRRAILPVGSTEQHGRHLPLATDAIIAEEVAARVSDLVGALALPCIPYGVSVEHRPLFNASISNHTLSLLVSDVCASLAENGVNRIVILNAHYGNESALNAAVQTAMERVPKNTLIYSLSYWMVMENEIGHADANETSLVLAIKPDLVNMKNARGGAVRLKPGKLKTREKLVLSRLSMLPSSMPKLAEAGVWGSPQKASSRKGRTMLDQIAARLATAIKDIEKTHAALFKERS